MSAETLPVDTTPDARIAQSWTNSSAPSSRRSATSKRSQSRTLQASHTVRQDAYDYTGSMLMVPSRLVVRFCHRSVQDDPLEYSASVISSWMGQIMYEGCGEFDYAPYYYCGYSKHRETRQ